MKTISNKDLRPFTIAVFCALYSIDSFSSFWRDLIQTAAKDGSKLCKWKYDDNRLTGLFIIANNDSLNLRNSDTKRWNTEPFSVNGGTAYLSTQWNNSRDGNFQLEFGPLCSFVKHYYPMCNLRYDNGVYIFTQTDGQEIKKVNKIVQHQPLQKIYFGTPGGGKSYKVKTLIEVTKKSKDRCFRTTFHPDTDYASFVGSYKPVMRGESICYKYVPQVFTLAYIAAWNDLDNEYFLDIEEINRGNCAQIFGDLFQLLDRNKNGYSEYPIQADTDLADYLLNAKDEDGKDILKNKVGIENRRLCLPPNFSIVATMNTSDQSLFPMDSAFKRRWDWEFVPSTFKEEDNYNVTLGKNVYKWHAFLKQANARIKQATDSEDKQMGSYFVKSDMDEEKFKSKVMYYLWSEICKEEYKTQNNFFRYIDEENNEQEFTFNELYSDGSTKILQKFMKFMNVSPVSGVNSEEEREDEE